MPPPRTIEDMRADIAQARRRLADSDIEADTSATPLTDLLIITTDCPRLLDIADIALRALEMACCGERDCGTCPIPKAERENTCEWTIGAATCVFALMNYYIAQAQEREQGGGS